MSERVITERLESLVKEHPERDYTVLACVKKDDTRESVTKIINHYF